MSSSARVLKIFLTLRSCSRIICARYSNDSKVDGQNKVNEIKQQLSQSPPLKEHLENTGNKVLISLTETSTDTLQKGDDTSKSFNQIKTHLEQESQESSYVFSEKYKSETEQAVKGESFEKNEIDSSTIKLRSVSDNKNKDRAFPVPQKMVKWSSETTEKQTNSPEQPQTFVSLLRQSPFIDLGDPVGKIVVGEIYLVVENDLYIDFGWKFHTVCPRPRKNPNTYLPGQKVLLKIKDLELCTKFLGDKNYISLLEADCDIVGIVSKKYNQENSAT